MGVGAVAQLQTVWTIADIAIGLMAAVNLVAILLLGKGAFGALRDFQRHAGAQAELPAFLGRGNPELPGDVPGDVWLSRTDTPTAERTA